VGSDLVVEELLQAGSNSFEAAPWAEATEVPPHGQTIDKQRRERLKVGDDGVLEDVDPLRGTNPKYHREDDLHR
jgi:hypothetical protein